MFVMKKIITLLLLVFSAFSFTSTAQPGTICNAEFSVQFINSNTVKFNPVVNNDSPFVQHAWNFADGSPVSNLISPVHNFAVPGSYPVVHTITRINANGVVVCTQSFTKIVNIIADCNLVANFSWTTVTTSPLTIAFQNLSVPLSSSDSITWNFGDNTISHDVSPHHTYANAGTYTVCLRIYRINTGSAPCVREICKTIVVTSPCNLQAYFSAQPDPNHPLRMKFTNLSAPIHATDSVRWTFGDGSSVSGLQSDPNVANPTHIYANAGTYTVCIRVKKNINTSPNPCVAEYCKQVVVTPPCNVQVDFSWRLDSSNRRKVYFTNLTVSPTAAASAKWTFGDGTTANTWNAVHEYAQPGRYIVCLRIEFGPNCVREKCDTIFIPHPVPTCLELSKFHFEKFSNDNQKYKFTPGYINTALQQTWTIKRLNGPAGIPPVILHQNNPTYLFQDTGYYNVCLRAVTLGGCVKEFCRTIHIERVANVCELQAYPNPTSGLINVNVRLNQPETIHAFIYNSLNVLVKEKHQQGNTGNNLVSINVNDLAAGLYTIKLIYGNKTCYARFQKL